MLAQSLHIARSVVVEAYEELVAAGFFVARPGSATLVGPGSVAASRAGAFSSPVAQPLTGASANQRPDEVVFNLVPGFPDTALIDARDWNRSWRAAARDAVDPLAIRNGRVQRNSTGTLQVQLADHLRQSRGMLIDPEDVYFFPRVNAAIRTLSQAVMKPGHFLAFEDPGYPAGRNAFVAGGSAVRPVPVDDQGLVVEQLDERDYGVYVTPAHQYPLGSRLSVRRRSALLEWATANSAVIFEDDYDGEFRYDVAPMPALRAMSAGADRVIYLGTTSKILTRDVRIAWAVVPSWLRQTVNKIQLQDAEGELVNAVAGSTLADFIQAGSLLRHISRSHRTYAARRHRFADACRTLLPGARLHGVDAGLHVVLTFTTDFEDVAAVKALLSAGLACSPLSQYFDRRSEAPLVGLVCGYATLPETRAMDAVSVIRDVLGPRLSAREEH
jgi:GntR family transcriptional regulator/MocR family aminotransferase